MRDKKRIIRFFLVGGLNTLFGFVVYTVFALTSLPTWLVLIATNTITLSFNFLTTGGLVFRQMAIRLLPRFLIVYGVIFCTYLGLINLLAPIVGGRIWAMAIIVLPVAVLTYLLQSIFVFRPPKS
ncbi:GtrA family protein [Achromobacter xylosoxidans]|uniref:GtrA family protein n=1 Tax=Alcaligenes xylosoxydans xylosoxydans TaxID=85698 RepID=UPI0013013BCA|nr:GtrA family protein [Achromobacter xylosoxidans]